MLSNAAFRQSPAVVMAEAAVSAASVSHLRPSKTDGFPSSTLRQGAHEKEDPAEKSQVLSESW